MQRLAQVVAGCGEELGLGAVGDLGLRRAASATAFSAWSCSASISCAASAMTLSNEAR
jgi:hypothetical protein